MENVENKGKRSEVNFEYPTPHELRGKADDATQNLIPAKSREKYIHAYNVFMQLGENHNCKSSFSENVILAFLNEKSETWKPSTLWAQYSMLRSTLNLNHNVDISKYIKVTAFLKMKSKGFCSKKSKIFTCQEIKKFLTEAPDDEHLATKVILIFGITGACRSNELTNLTIKHIETHGKIYFVNIQKTKTYVQRSFTIPEKFAHIVKQYAALRPHNTATDRFFLNYQKGKCSNQVIGINKFAKTPQKIAEYLKLENSELYTGHSLRRTSATLLADSGANITALKRHGGWKSSTVAEGYIEAPMSNQNKIANQIVSTISLPSSSIASEPPSKLMKMCTAQNQNASITGVQIENLSDQEVQLPSRGISIQMTNCSNCTINLGK